MANKPTNIAVAAKRARKRANYRKTIARYEAVLDVAETACGLPDEAIEKALDAIAFHRIGRKADTIVVPLKKAKPVINDAELRGRIKGLREAARICGDYYGAVDAAYEIVNRAQRLLKKLK